MVKCVYKDCLSTNLDRNQSMPFLHLIHFRIYMIEALIVGQLTSVISIVYQFSSTRKLNNVFVGCVDMWWGF